MSAALGPQPVWFRVRSPVVLKWCAVERIDGGSYWTFCNGRVATYEDVETGTPSDLERCSLCRSRVALKTNFVRVQCSQLAPVEENVVELTVEDFDEEVDTPTYDYPPGFIGGEAG